VTGAGVSLRVAYQGVPGAYSEECAATLFPDAAYAGERTFAAVFAALEGGTVGAAVVPVENSTAGAVSDVYDLLLGHESVVVVGEAVLQVRHCLLGPPGARLEDVREARSHPQALAQSEAFLRARGIEAREAYDTAGAAREVRDLNDPRIAAVASRRAAEQLGLDVLAKDIQTVSDNSTRFFVLARRDDSGVAAAMAPAHRDGPPKTSLVFASDDKPGALVRALQPFATAGVNLAKIESRPSRDRPWTYVFYLDIHGDVAESPAREAFALLRTCCSWVRVLGTYPMAAPAPPAPPRPASGPRKAVTSPARNSPAA